MKLIIVSGRSGSGKSTALHVLEDLGFYCIDNLPIGLLFPLTREAASQTRPGRLGKMAVSIDARNLSGELANFEEIYRRLQETGVTVEIIFLDADEQSLLQRFHATRRKHPLSDDRTSLREAITSEKKLLEPLSKLSDLYVNTTGMSMYELRDMVKQRVVGRKDQELAPPGSRLAAPLVLHAPAPSPAPGKPGCSLAWSRDNRQVCPPAHAGNRPPPCQNGRQGDAPPTGDPRPHGFASCSRGNRRLPCR